LITSIPQWYAAVITKIIANTDDCVVKFTDYGTALIIHYTALLILLIPFSSSKAFVELELNPVIWYRQLGQMQAESAQAYQQRCRRAIR
jgi:hypothetical protein